MRSVSYFLASLSLHPDSCFPGHWFLNVVPRGWNIERTERGSCIAAGSHEAVQAARRLLLGGAP